MSFFWCFQTVVLEKTLQSPLDSKEIKPVNPKGNQPWIFIGRIDAEAEVPILCPPNATSWLTGKDPDAREDWGQEEKGVTEDGMAGWYHWLNGHELSKLWEIVKDREAQCAAVHGAAKSHTQFNNWKMTIFLIKERWTSFSLCKHVKVKVAQSCPTLCNPMDYSPWNSPGQNTGWSSLSLLQGIFPTQRPNPGLLHCRRILYQLSHKGSPRILEWVAFPFSSGASQPKNQTGVPCIAGGFLINWAMREDPKESQSQRMFKLLYNCTRFTC